MPTNVSQMDVPLFSGQGNVAVDKTSTYEQALRDAESTSGSTFLHSCFNAFHTEIDSLEPKLRKNAGIDSNDFSTPKDLLKTWAGRYAHNSILSGSKLFLIHCLRYLAYTESSESFSPAEVLGFSSGIIPAAVVSASSTTKNFTSRAVEAYRLVLWIGIRSQLYRKSELEPVPFIDIDTQPWSVVFIGTNKDVAQKAVDQFNNVNPLSPIFITAVMDSSSVTVSGRPDVLAEFTTNYRKSTSVHPTKINTLYHAPIHATTLRHEILSDVERRSISFPDFVDIKVPIRSSYTGELLTPSSDSKSLLEYVVDMVIVEPVNWDRVNSGLVKSTSESHLIKLINFGPGNGIARGMEKSFPKGRLSVVDVSMGNSSGPSKPPADSIAICGMSIHMPGARNTNELWELLEKGINTVAEIPEDRFKISEYNPATSSNTKRTMKAKTANCIDGVDEFDNQFFKISPREAKSMDPQQRILLQTTYEALEDAGYVPDSTPSFRRDTFGCFVGVATHDYIQNLRDEIDVYYSTGTLKAFLSGRISYAMQWGGPSAVVDTACSSSMVAVYQGARALMNRDCNAAIVGGVNIFSSPDMFLGLDRGHFLSPTGQCKPFDASADGYSRSEGCGIFVLKRLDDAIMENDNILGVIRGVEVNQSGLAHSITHPHAPTQTSLFERLLDKSGIPAERINVVEAHGTGTQAGDPVEMESLRKVLCHQRTAQNPLHIMSIKANIGHLEAASGAAGLAKLLLMFDRKIIPRQISLQNLNPRIDALENDNTRVNTTHVSWEPSHEGQTRIALLNNFGAAGSNAAAIIEEYVSPSPAAVDPTAEFLFGLSAKSEKALQDLKSRFVEWLSSSASDKLRLADIAYTTTARRQMYSHRICVTASSKNELIQNLSSAAIQKSPEGHARVVFVFSGQGSQYLGMGKALYERNTAFKEVIDDCHAFLIDKGFPGVLPILTSSGESSGLTKLEEFEAYQAAIFALEYAIARLWISWGLSPFAVIGHSLGEYAALVIADVISLEDALTLVASRVRFMVQKCETDTTGMMAVSMSATEIRELVRGSILFSDISVSCINSPSDCVVSGPKESLTELKKYLDDSKRCKSVILSVPFGYHSSAMDPLLDDLTQVAEQMCIRSPMIPIVSNVFGQLVMPGDDGFFNAGYFARHCAEPVQFETGVRSMLSTPSFEEVDAWLEIGPHASLLPMLKSNPLSASKGVFLTSLRKHKNPWSTMMIAASQLYTCNARMSWRTMFSHIPSVSCVSLPHYPFSKSKFWVAFKEASPAAVELPLEAVKSLPSVDSAVLESWLQYPSSENGMVAIFETPISKLSKFITGHSVGGHPLCPASVYIEQVFSGVRAAEQHTHKARDKTHVNIRKLKFVNPLVYNPEVARTIVTKITLDQESGHFTISSHTSSDGKETVHVQGEYRVQSDSSTTKKLSKCLPVVTRRAAAVRESRNGEEPEIFSRRTAYEVIFPRVVAYSREYHTMQSLTVGVDGMEGSASVKLPGDHLKDNFVVHPVFMDTLLHTPGFVSNLQGGDGDALICAEVGSVKVVPELIDSAASYTVYCSIALLEDGNLRLAEAFAVRQGEQAQVVAHMKDIHFRRVRLASLKKGLGIAAGAPATQPETAVPQSKVTARHAPRPAPAVQVLSESPVRPSQPAIDVHDAVLRIVSETCAVASAKVKDDTDLSSLGVDSMMFIEILEKLKQSFTNLNVDPQAFQTCHTVSEMVHSVSSALPATPVLSQKSEVVAVKREEEARIVEGKSERTEQLDLKQILASVLDMDAKNIPDDADFDSLGLDSLSAIEALKAFKVALKMDLPDDYFTLHPTIKAIQFDLLNREGRRPSSLTNTPFPEAKLETIPALSESVIRALKLDSTPVTIQKSLSNRLPLFVIHDGSGLINYYERLSPLGRVLKGIHNPHFSTATPWTDIRQMASSYADLIAKSGEKSILIGGWSFGGVAAYETSLQLQKRGVTVRGIVLIDSPSPVNHVPLSESLIEAVVELDRRTSSDLGRLVKSQFRLNSALLGNYDACESSGMCPPIVLLRSSEGFKSERVASSKIPSWLAERGNPKDAVVGWEKLTGSSIKIIDIPGNHFEPFKPHNIEHTGKAIAEACIHFERL
ncbi:polyketide synthase [Dendrothele bispora CBS 962.96]|uniref:Polyketide synthase n=1 Tax=Dendrothele bispora (strain CBS 962.96) TaxID=1314807 RepID=A0A4S8LT81_DENBC|nr:polyketide synthase [Dendrothele bispora CBS 962.96]